MVEQNNFVEITWDKLMTIGGTWDVIIKEFTEQEHIEEEIDDIDREFYTEGAGDA